MRGQLGLVRALFLVLVTGHGAPAFAELQADPWQSAYNSATGSRFIPVELWTGGQWDGNRELAATKADFGKDRRSVTGPLEWTRPGTGEKLMVYERLNRDKKQLFVINSNKDGIGRVEDSRYGRNCVDEVKFPLGLWRQGEKRVFEITCNDGSISRTIVVTIERLDFTYRGISHSLQFHWVVDGGRARGTDMHYVYSPGKGLVNVWGNE